LAHHPLEHNLIHVVKLMRKQAGDMFGDVAMREGNALAGEIGQDGVDLCGEHDVSRRRPG